MPPVLWSPPPDIRDRTEVGRYLRWLERERGLTFETYEDLQRWSVDDLPAFWASIWDFFEVRSSEPYTAVVENIGMPGARWFPGTQLNFAQNLLRYRDDHAALVFRNDRGATLFAGDRL